MFLLLSSLATARADSIQILSVGVIGSGSVGRSSMAGVGAEATLTSIGDHDVGYGLFAQAETGGRAYAETASIRDQQRYAGGLMLFKGFVGLDVGGLYRTAPMLDPTPGVQVGLFASVGLMSIELRTGLASAGTPNHPQYGSDIGLVVAAKLPVQIGGKALTIKNVALLPCVWRCRSKD